MRFRSFVAFVAVAALWSIGPASHVSAHAELDRSVPKADSTVTSSPAMVELWFTEEIGKGSKIVVKDSAGKEVQKGDAELDLMDPDRKHLTVALQPNLASGVYTVTWTSQSSEDGDEETGTFQFKISGAATPVAPPSASPQSSPAATKESGSQQAPPEADPANIDERALAIAVGAGVLVALLIYGFSRLVRPRRHPFDRTGK